MRTRTLLVAGLVLAGACGAALVSGSPLEPAPEVVWIAGTQPDGPAVEARAGTIDGPAIELQRIGSAGLGVYTTPQSPLDPVRRLLGIRGRAKTKWIETDDWVEADGVMYQGHVQVARWLARLGEPLPPRLDPYADGSCAMPGPGPGYVPDDSR